MQAKSILIDSLIIQPSNIKQKQDGNRNQTLEIFSVRGKIRSFRPIVEDEDEEVVAQELYKLITVAHPKLFKVTKQEQNKTNKG